MKDEYDECGRSNEHGESQSNLPSMHGITPLGYLAQGGLRNTPVGTRTLDTAALEAAGNHPLLQAFKIFSQSPGHCGCVDDCDGSAGIPK